MSPTNTSPSASLSSDTPDRSIVVLATAWGPRFGGINSFNFDLCLALSRVLRRHRVVCVVPSASEAEVIAAMSSGVTLITLGAGPAVDDPVALSGAVAAVVAAHIPLASVDWWLGHDAKTGPLAVALAGHSNAGRAATIMHMSYDDYAYVKQSGNPNTRAKIQAQKKALQAADCAFAVGPLLYERLRELRTPVAKANQMLIPGLPDPSPAISVARLSGIALGRFEASEGLMKQAPLVVAGFAEAIKVGREYGLAALESPVLRVFGVPPDACQQLKDIAEHRADRVWNIQLNDFIESREELRSYLLSANLSLMLSWHEGFGLSAWEAIGVGLPTIISRGSGVYRLLRDLGGQATGCIHAIDVRGRSSDAEPFSSDDLVELRNTIISIATELPEHVRDAATLSGFLREQLCFTWARTAADVAAVLGLPADSPERRSGAEPLVPSDERILRVAVDEAEANDAVRLASTFVELGRYDDALEAVREVEPDRASSSLKLRVLLLRATCALRLNRYYDAEQLAEAASKTGRELNEWCAAIEAEGVRNTIRRDTGYYDEAVAIGRALVTMANDNCPDAAAGAHRKLARALALRGDWQDGLRHATIALALDRAKRNAVGEAKALLAMGEAHRFALNLTDAIVAYTQSRDLAAREGHIDCYLWAMLGLGDTLFLLRDLDQANQVLGKLEELLRESRQKYPLEALHLSFSRAVIARLRGEEAAEYVADLLSRYQALGITWPPRYLEAIDKGSLFVPKQL